MGLLVSVGMLVIAAVLCGAWLMFMWQEGGGD